MPARPVEPPPAAPSWYDPAATRHDFGLILAGTEVTRSHTFRVVNTSNRPVPIRGVANRKPCCGDVAPVAATTLEPGRALEVPVTLKLGLGSGKVVHVATVEVAGGDEEINLSTEATTQARATVDEVPPGAGTVEIGRSGRVEYLIRSFGVEGDPPRALDESAIRCELPTAWAGPATTDADRGDHLIATHRLLAVTLPASREHGRRSALLEVCGDDGAVIGRRQVAWEVPAALTASPAGLVLAAGAGRDLKVVVRCRDDRAFRITEATTSVAGLVVAIDDGARATHTLRGSYTPPSHPGPKAGEVIVRTDHPAQSVVKVAVYVAGSGTDPVAPAPSRSSP